MNKDSSKAEGQGATGHATEASLEQARELGEKHPEYDPVEAELFLQLLEKFGGMPFRGGKQAIRMGCVGVDYLHLKKEDANPRGGGAKSSMWRVKRT